MRQNENAQLMYMLLHHQREYFIFQKQAMTFMYLELKRKSEQLWSSSDNLCLFLCVLHSTCNDIFSKLWSGFSFCLYNIISLLIFIYFQSKKLFTLKFKTTLFLYTFSFFYFLYVFPLFLCFFWCFQEIHLIFTLF